MSSDHVDFSQASKTPLAAGFTTSDFAGAMPPPPPPPDSLSRATTVAAATRRAAQLSKHWATAANDTSFPDAGLLTIAEALNSRSPSNRSRFAYIANGNGVFADPHARLCGMAFLAADYASRRANSNQANNKWLEARRSLLDLQSKLPENLHSAPIFTKVADTKRPPRTSFQNDWRSR